MKIVKDMTNDEYHSDNGYYSSSQLKLMLQDPELFHQKYILKKTKQEKKEVFDIGNAVHIRLLEPEKYEDEVAFWDGKIKRGAKWDEFKSKHDGKIIIGNMAKFQVDLAINNVLNTPSTLPYLTGGQAEVSYFGELEGLPVKIRTDYLGKGNSFIQDIKTTTGLITELSVKKKIEQLDYDLSAAQYCDLTGVDKFVWIFTSKDFESCRVFIASPEMLENGRKKYKDAIKLIKYYQSIDWKFSESVIEIDPIRSYTQIELDNNEKLW